MSIHNTLKTGSAVLNDIINIVFTYTVSFNIHSLWVRRGYRNRHVHTGTQVLYVHNAQVVITRASSFLNLFSPEFVEILWMAIPWTLKFMFKFSDLRVTVIVVKIGKEKKKKKLIMIVALILICLSANYILGDESPLIVFQLPDLKDKITVAVFTRTL